MDGNNYYGAPIDEVIRQHRGRILQRAYAILRDVEEAQEAAQEVSWKLHEKAHLFREGAEITRWIYRITTNTAIDRYRKNKKSPLTYTQDVMDWAYLGHNPEKRYISHIDTNKFLGLLSPDKRRMLLLRYEGFDYEEIAEMLKIPIGTVRSRLHRLREESKAFLHRGVIPNGYKVRRGRRPQRAYATEVSYEAPTSTETKVLAAEAPEHIKPENHRNKPLPVRRAWRPGDVYFALIEELNANLAKARSPTSR